MDRLNFNHLYYFYVVAKEGSIKEAATKLYVSQPTISDQIKLLEEFFGCRLFERKHRSLLLTKEGQLAEEYARKIFDQSYELTSRLRNQIKIPKSTFDIGLTHFMSQYFLYDTILPMFEQDEISIKIHENPRYLLLAELEKNNIDMVITDTKEGILPTMNAYRMGVNRTFVVAHKKFSSSKKNFPESLNEIPFLTYTNDSSLKFEIELFFSKHKIAPRIIGEADDVDLFQVVADRGLAFTIVPEVAKNRMCMNKNIIVLGEIEDFQTTVWGIINDSYRGIGYKFLKKKLYTGDSK